MLHYLDFIKQKVPYHTHKKNKGEKVRKAKMKVVEVLHMNGGNGDVSYANNSLVQVT